MDRGERRYNTARVRGRRLRLFYMSMGPHGWEYVEERPWRALSNMGAYFMRDPGRWEREMMIRPARARQNHMLRTGDFDGVFPNYKKPVIYYW